MARRKKGAVPAARTDLEDLVGAWRIGLDPDLLVTALTHRSFAFETTGVAHNERLEFLGDSVLGVTVTTHLFAEHPTASEANLSRMRGAIVSEKTLAEVARRLHLGDFILLGKGENLTGGRERDSILSDTLEAMIGATYLCHGLDVTRQIILHHLAPYLERAVELGRSSDFKTTLQEFCAEFALGEPSYADEGFGPDHQRRFVSTTRVGGQVVGAGMASSKKQARAVAAEVAYRRLRSAGGQVGPAVLDDPLPLGEGGAVRAELPDPATGRLTSEGGAGA